MAITFRKITDKKVYINTPFRAKIERYMGKMIQTNQLKRIENEILLSGYVTSLEEVTDELLRNYVLFKQKYPRTSFIKEYWEKAKQIGAKMPELITAEKIYYSLKEIVNFDDRCIYKWFEKIGSKFTTKGEYSREIYILVTYSALLKKAKSNEKD